MRTVLALSLLLVLSAFQQEPAPRDPARERPNIVLVMADDVSADDIGCNGNPDVRTPHLDQLAAAGRRWTRAYLTTSQCSPTRASVITGRYPHNTGAPELHLPLPEGQPLFPLALRRAGYFTGAAGKWHLGPYARTAFDEIRGGGKGSPGGEGAWVPLLRERPKDRPFFLWLASSDAHRTWQPDPEGEPHDPAGLTLPVPLVDTPSTRQDLASYYDEVQRIDRFVGRVVAELERQGELENTLVLFMADNGRPFPRAKRWLVDAGIRTPLIAHWPAGLGAPGTPCEELVSVLDIAPTFLGLAGVAVPEAFQGRSFAPQLEDPGAAICELVFAERNWHGEYAHERMVRRGDLVYLRNGAPELPHFAAINWHREFPAFADLVAHARSGAELTPEQRDVFRAPRPAEQLFDLATDPTMVRDLAADPDHAEALAGMSLLMDRWQEETGDTVPGPDARTPDREDRETGEPTTPGKASGHPVDGELPGESRGAEAIVAPGPR